MQTIQYTCEVLSPMFLNGADGQSPELRAPSLKGALRYWWRALHGHIGSGELRSKEEELFGGGSVGARRSSLILNCRELEPWIIVNAEPMPGKRHPKNPKPMLSQAIRPGSRFEITLRFAKEPAPGYFDALLALTACLGGLGKRSRRGMGSWRILEYSQNYGSKEPYAMPEDMPSVLEKIRVISKHYGPNADGSKILLNYAGSGAPFPWLRWIEFGEKLGSDMQHLRHIRELNHEMQLRHKQNYDPAMGYANRGKRFASPMYTSLLGQPQKLRILLSSLNTIPGIQYESFFLPIQEEYRERLFQ